VCCVACLCPSSVIPLSLDLLPMLWLLQGNQNKARLQTASANGKAPVVGSTPFGLHHWSSSLQSFGFVSSPLV
jgi:hypothetical protein